MLSGGTPQRCVITGARRGRAAAAKELIVWTSSVALSARTQIGRVNRLSRCSPCLGNSVRVRDRSGRCPPERRVRFRPMRIALMEWIVQQVRSSKPYRSRAEGSTRSSLSIRRSSKGRLPEMSRRNGVMPTIAVAVVNAPAPSATKATVRLGG